MLDGLLVLILVLGLPGLLPAAAFCRETRTLIFLAPLTGTFLAAVAAEFELTTAGSISMWYCILAFLANAVAIAVLLLRRPVGSYFHIRSPLSPRAEWPWWLALLLAVLVAMAVPLSALHIPMIGYDTNAIWLTHTLMVSGGHTRFLRALHDPAYLSSNPDYPPAVAASGALALALFGHSDLRSVPALIGFLNGCTVGVMVVGLARLADWVGNVPRAVFTVGVEVVLVLATFAVAGMFAVTGYADLLWAGAAAAAVVWGLLLPKERSAIAVAGLTAGLAAVTKNEGLTSAIAIVVLVAVRYTDLPTLVIAHIRSQGMRSLFKKLLPSLLNSVRAQSKLLLYLVPIAAGLVWPIIIRSIGLHSDFFGAPTTESPISRVSPTLAAMSQRLPVVIPALAVTGFGYWKLHEARNRAGAAAAGWLWTAAAACTLLIAAAYVFGDLEIHWWLRQSVNRTTIFTIIVLMCDMSAWLLMAGTALPGPPDRVASRTARSRPIAARTTTPAKAGHS